VPTFGTGMGCASAVVMAAAKMMTMRIMFGLLSTLEQRFKLEENSARFVKLVLAAFRKTILVQAVDDQVEHAAIQMGLKKTARF
jgi:hypothetical protein